MKLVVFQVGAPSDIQILSKGLSLIALLRNKLKRGSGFLYYEYVHFYLYLSLKKFDTQKVTRPFYSKQVNELSIRGHYMPLKISISRFFKS